jgi:hypothetical protein
MLLADICDISQRENAEKPKLWVVVSGQADNAEASLGRDANPAHRGQQAAKPSRESPSAF